jgi:hypothetical protein
MKNKAHEAQKWVLGAINGGGAGVIFTMRHIVLVQNFLRIVQVLNL